MNIIFLDIDGVLNGYNKFNLLGWKIVTKLKYKPLINLFRNKFHPFTIHESKVKRLSKIVNATNAKIVMSSSWRHGWWKKPYELQWDDQKRLTDLLNKYSIDVVDIIPTLSSGHRGSEIELWLKNNKDKVNNFIILDDENSDMSPFIDLPNFIQTSNVTTGDMIIGRPNENTGLKRKHVNQAIKILLME